MDSNKFLKRSGNYTIRLLKESEFQLYKSIRLEAIRQEPAMFRRSIPAETDLTDAEWLERIKLPRAVFGVFDKVQLIGMTSILLVNEEEGFLGQSYIRKEHRGKGLAALLYKARMVWASAMDLKRLSVSHRESNAISKAANQRSGFQYSHREPANWLDDTSEDVLYYVLELQ